MKRPVIPIILAIVLAIGAGAAVYLYARGTENRVLEQQQAAPALLSEAAIPRGTALVEAQADGLVPAQAADMPAYTQGLMDLGAGVCTPRSPDCAACPVAAGTGMWSPPGFAWPTMRASAVPGTWPTRSTSAPPRHSGWSSAAGRCR